MGLPGRVSVLASTWGRIADLEYAYTKTTALFPGPPSDPYPIPPTFPPAASAPLPPSANIPGSSAVLPSSPDSQPPSKPLLFGLAESCLRMGESFRDSAIDFAYVLIEVPHSKGDPNWRIPFLMGGDSNLAIAFPALEIPTPLVPGWRRETQEAAFRIFRYTCRQALP